MTVIYTCCGVTPRVMIAALVSNQARWLKRFLYEIDNLDYPEELITYAFLTGNNDDDTFDILREFEQKHQGSIPWCSSKEKVWLKGEDINKGSLSRFEGLTTLRNSLVRGALANEDYVLMIDSDIVKIPKDLIQRLMDVDSEVVAPMIYIDNFREFGDTYFYDNLAYIKDGANFDHFYPYIPGHGELPEEPVYVDSVGACYLVSANIFRAGVQYVSYPNVSEQVTFCEDVRKRGFRVAVHPQVAVLHTNGEEYSVPFK